MIVKTLPMARCSSIYDWPTSPCSARATCHSPHKSLEHNEIQKLPKFMFAIAYRINSLKTTTLETRDIHFCAQSWLKALKKDGIFLKIFFFVNPCCCIVVVYRPPQQCWCCYPVVTRLINNSIKDNLCRDDLLLWDCYWLYSGDRFISTRINLN